MCSNLPNPQDLSWRSCIVLVLWISSSKFFEEPWNSSQFSQGLKCISTLPLEVLCVLYKKGIIAHKKKKRKGKMLTKNLISFNKINKTKVSHCHGHENLQE